MAGSDDDSYEARSKRLQTLQDDHDRLRRELRDEFGHGGSIFAAFKRFVDDNVSTLTDNFRNLPSNIAELRASVQREKNRHAQEEADIERRWIGPFGAAVQPSADEMSNASRHVKFALRRAAHLNAHVSPAKIVKLYEDKEAGMGLLDSLASPLLALGGTWYFLPETGDTLPTASNWTLRGNGARWLSVDWFKRSPYSPLRLEAHPDFQCDGAKWRMAFEDLLLATLDKPMSDNRLPMTSPRMQRTIMTPGVDWMFDLQYSGVLPPLLPRFYGDSKARRVLGHTSIADVIASCKDTPTAEQSFPWIDSLSRDFAELTTEMAYFGDIREWDNVEAPMTRSAYEHRLTQQLENYRMQLMTLEAQNKQRMLEAGTEVAATSFTDEDECDEFDDPEDEEEDEFDDPEDEEEDEFDDPEDEEEDDEYGDDYDVYLALYQRERAKRSRMMERIREEAGLVLSDNDIENWEALGYLGLAQLADKDAAAKVEHLLRKYNPEGSARGVHDDETELMLANMWHWLNAESWEQQRENMEVMVGERKAPEPVEVVKEKLPEVPVPVVGEQKRVDVLSALTTTQTTRLPDGTVTTKVVLKKRFADGREETSESVHTTNELVEAELRRRDQEEEKTISRGGKGWFWS